MSNIISIHGKNPQLRKINEVINVLSSGGVVVYPTDSGYALGCLPGFKNALQRIIRIRELDKRHLFTLLCPSIAAISQYAHISTPAFRLIKSHTPGPYTFVLSATKEVPKSLLLSKQKTIGVRIPSHPVILALLEQLTLPLLNVSLILPLDDDSTEIEDSFCLQVAASCVDEVEDVLINSVDMMIDSDYCCPDPTTIIDLSGPSPLILRHGSGDLSGFS